MAGLSLKYTPDELEALFEQAFALHESGQLSAAAQCYENLLLDFPQDCELLAGLGTVDLQLGNFAAAVPRLEASLAGDPEQAWVLNNLGLALLHLDQSQKALASVERAVAIDPTYAEAFFNRGNALNALQRRDEALASYARALALNPAFAACYLNRGSVWQAMQQHAAALDDFRQALSLDADQALIYNNCGISLHALQRLEEALLNYDKALVLKPELAQIYLYRGNALLTLKRVEAAGSDFERAIALQPDYSEAHWGKALLQVLKREYAAAIADFTQALAFNPNSAELFMQRGNAYYQIKQYAAAERDFEQALALKPDYSETYMRLAVLKILSGDYETGWRLYEWRWQDQQKHLLRRFEQAVWLGGQEIAGKTVLLHAEQGLGDFIQFSRYAALFETLGAQALLEAPAPLFALMTSLAGNLTVLKQGADLPAFDLHCPIMSLPLAFNTRLESIPKVVPYLFAEQAKSRLWQARLGAKKRLRVGVVWSGSSAHENDQQRSISLAWLAPLWQLPCDFHALQKEFRPADAELLPQTAALQTHAEQLNDFSDTAALVDNMDLVLSVDTSVAHLAGAMAKPVWILLPYSPDYRWLMDRTDSPWYPSAKLFRQPAVGDWGSVVAAVADDLRKWLVEDRDYERYV